jgi:hypothetical protein
MVERVVGEGLVSCGLVELCPQTGKTLVELHEKEV